MAHMIESAKSGRASCKVCKETIAKGELRLGEEFPNPFSEGEFSYRWHHLECGAKKKPSVLKKAMELAEIELPERGKLLELIRENARDEEPTVLPYAEFAKTGRSSCIQCSEKIEKGEVRIAASVESEGGDFGSRKGFLHPACAVDFLEADPSELFDKLKENSHALEEGDLESLEAEIFG